MIRVIAVAYFSHIEARAASRRYYRNLSTAIQTGSRHVETVVRDAMTQRIALWERLNVV